MFYPMLALGCLVGVTACGDDDEASQEPTAKVKFELSAESVTATAEGGRASIGYTLENPGANLSIEVTSDEEWVNNFKTKSANKITFDVVPNELTEAREAVVSVTYSDDDNEDIKTSFTVKQEAAEPDFVITQGEMGSSWIKLGMTPKDNSMPYMLGALPVEDMDGYTSDEAFFNSQIEELQAFADYVGATLEQVIEVFFSKGAVADGIITMLEPNTEYYIYCYGITSGNELATTVIKQKFTTPAATRVNNTITVNVVKEAVRSLTMDVTTTTPDSYVMVYAPKAELAGITDARLGKMLLDERYETLAGNQSGLVFDELTPNTEYTIVVMGRAGGVATTDVARFDAKTKETQQSNITYSLFNKKYFDALQVKGRHPQIFPAGMEVTANDAIIAAYVKADGAKSINSLVAAQAFLDQLAAKLGRELTEDDYATLAIQNSQSAANILTVVSYDEPVVIIGVATDSDGNRSKVYLEELTITKKDIAPVEEFDAYLAGRRMMQSILPKTDASSLKTLLPNKQTDGIVLKSVRLKTVKGLWHK